MGKYSRLGKNLFLVILGSIGSKIISILMLPLYTSWLSPADYGATDLIQTYALLLLPLLTCCLTDAIFLYPKASPIDAQKKYFTSGFTFAAIVFLIVAFFLALLKGTGSLLLNSFFDKYAFLIFILIISSFIQSYTQQFTRSIDRMGVYVISGVLQTFFIALFSFLLIPKHGVVGYIYAQVIANVFSAIYSFIHAKLIFYFCLNFFSRKYLREMLCYSVALIPTNTIWWLINSLNRPIIEKFCGIDSVGIFAVSSKFPAVLSLVWSVFIISWQISVVEEFDKPDYSVFYNRIFKSVYTGCILLCCAVTLLSQFLVELITTEDFYSAWTYIPILVFGVMFNNFAGFLGTNFTATKKSKHFLTTTIWGALVSLVLNYVLIPKLGLMGASISILCSGIAIFITRLFYTQKYVKLVIDRYIISLLVLSFALVWCVLYVHHFYYRTLSIAFILILVIKLVYPQISMMLLLAKKVIKK